jgi:Zinc carboxypeptidase
VIRRTVTSVIAVLALLATVLAAAPAQAQVNLDDSDVAPPWCGVPVPDAAENLPDGTDPSDPPGSFPHIPYYAIQCTLEDIVASSNGRMTLEVMGKSALGRDLFLVTVNALDTVQQRKDWQAWQQVRKVALTDPARGQQLLASYGDDVKVPLYIQGAIHGNEYEGVEAIFETLETLATTPYGEDPAVDAVLDHTVLLFNVIQNPDGRVAGTRANGNGFDLNRDFMTQSQPETKASVAVMQKWLPPEVLDLHGYVTPTLIEATTKPHNPSIDYDLWLKWNQPRIDANEAALAELGYDVTRPINDWCSDGNPAPSSGICPDGQPPGPAVAEGWDDWGPFYTPMYAQHVGLNGSTVEMCNQTDEDCALPDTSPFAYGRLGSRIIQESVIWSSLHFDIENRNELLHDELERYRRGVENEPRPPCCEPPFDIDNNWMEEFPTAYIVPMGSGQRSEPEANRLVDWLIANGILVHEMKQAYTFEGVTYPKGSYVVFLNQAHRGLADTALGLGADISEDISILYAPPAAWSHGYLWGADVVRVEQDAAFTPQTNRILRASHLLGGVEPGTATAYALKIDSPTAVRTLNALTGEGVTAQLAQAPFTSASGATLPTGSAIFAADAATKVRLASIGRDNDVWFHRVGTTPPTEAIEGMPRILVLTGALNQDVWSLQNLGFTPAFMSTGALNSAAENPLPDYDVIWNTGGWPSATNPVARQRLTDFFHSGGGYIGAGAGGANFLTAGGLVTGLTAATRSGNGRSGIVYWDNVGGAASPITGASPARDTAIMDPPTWFTSVPATMSVDGRFPTPPDPILASGLWLLDAQSASAPGSAVIAHGTTASGRARATVFAMNPLYRADPEREWSMVGLAAYWADQ